MNILDVLLETDSRQRFLSENYGRIPYARPFAAKQYLGYLDWPVIVAMLERGGARFRVAKNFTFVRDPFLSNAQELAQLYQSKHSIVIRHSERSCEKIAALADAFKQDLKLPVDIQSFITPQEEMTFNWHYDVEHVFIIQTSGEKKYFLRQNTLNPDPSLETMGDDLHYEKEGWIFKCGLILP